MKARLGGVGVGLLDGVGRIAALELQVQQGEASVRQGERRRRRVHRLLGACIAVEPLVWLGCLLCADAVTSLMLVAPARALAVLLRRVGGATKRASFLRSRDGVLASILLLSLLCVHVCNSVFRISYASAYHVIRRQSYFKVYLLSSISQILDRVLSMFGCEITGCLLHDEALRRKSLGRIIAEIGACVVYCGAHVMILYMQTVTLNVVMNSKQGSLMVVIISSNFSEMKASVMKRFSEVNAFQIASADIVERFQLLLVMFVIALQNLVQIHASDAAEWCQHAALASVLVLSLESIVDWVKHGFLIHFNNLDLSSYYKFGSILSHDLASSPQFGQRVTDRIGLVPLPAAAILLRALLQGWWRLQLSAIWSTSKPVACVVVALGISCAYAGKLLLRIVLIGYCAERAAEAPAETTEVHKWKKITRYTVQGKSLPKF